VAPHTPQRCSSSDRVRFREMVRLGIATRSLPDRQPGRTGSGVLRRFAFRDGVRSARAAVVADVEEHSISRLKDP
jgi:hypothetical protein